MFLGFNACDVPCLLGLEFPVQTQAPEVLYIDTWGTKVFKGPLPPHAEASLAKREARECRRDTVVNLHRQISPNFRFWDNCTLLVISCHSEWISGHRQITLSHCNSKWLYLRVNHVSKSQDRCAIYTYLALLSQESCHSFSLCYRSPRTITFFAYACKWSYVL